MEQNPSRPAVFLSVEWNTLLPLRPQRAPPGTYSSKNGASSRRSMRSCPSVVVARRLRRDVPVLQRRFQDPAAVELTHRGAVDLLPGRAALRYRRDALLALAAFDLLVRHQHVAAPGVEVDADHVAGSQPGQAAAGCALGRGVEDRRAVGGAGLPAVADGGQGVYPAFQERVRRLHVDDLGRARPTDRAGAPDHQDGALVDAQVRIVDALVVVVGAVEDDRAAFEHAGVAEVARAEVLGDHARL